MEKEFEVHAKIFLYAKVTGVKTEEDAKHIFMESLNITSENVRVEIEDEDIDIYDVERTK